MVFANFKNKIFSFAGTVINHVCLAIAVSAPSLSTVSFPTVASPAIKAVQDVLPAPVYRAYEEFRKIPVQTEYKTQVEFLTVGEAKAALAADLLDAYRTPLPGNFCRPQTEYKTNLKFDSVDKAQAAMTSDLLEAYSSSFPGKVSRPQVSDKVSLY
ncbi:unnamed protein product [Mucor fragilis]